MFVCLRHSFFLHSFSHISLGVFVAQPKCIPFIFYFLLFSVVFFFFAVFLNCSSSHMLIHVVNDCSTISFLEKFTCVLLTVQTSTITQAQTHTKRQPKNTKAFKNNSIPYAPVCANFVCLFASFFPLFQYKFQFTLSEMALWWWFGVQIRATSFHFSFIGNIYGFFLSKKKKTTREIMHFYYSILIFCLFVRYLFSWF